MGWSEGGLLSEGVMILLVRRRQMVPSGQRKYMVICCALLDKKYMASDDPCVNVPGGITMLVDSVMPSVFRAHSVVWYAWWTARRAGV